MRLLWISLLALATCCGCKGFSKKSEIDRFLSQTDPVQDVSNQSLAGNSTTTNKNADLTTKVSNPIQPSSSKAEFKLSSVDSVIGSGLNEIKPPTTRTPNPKPEYKPLYIVPKNSEIKIAGKPNNESNPLRPRHPRPKWTLRELVKTWSSELASRNASTNTKPCPIIDCDTCNPVKKKPNRFVAAPYVSADNLDSFAVKHNTSLTSYNAPAANHPLDHVSPATPNQPMAPMAIPANPCQDGCNRHCGCRQTIQTIGYNEVVDEHPKKQVFNDPLEDWVNSESPDANWNEHLQQTLETLANEVEFNNEQCNPCKLRLLRLLSDNIIRATEPIESISPETQTAFIAQMSAIEKMIELAEKDWNQTDAKKRSVLIRDCLSNLQTAVAAMVKQTPLQIQNPQLCTEIRGFGQYKSVQTEQPSNSNLLLYCEVENLSHTQTDRQKPVVFETKIQGEIEIVDGRGKQISHHKFPIVTDSSRRLRRDYFVYFPIRTPRQSGAYKIIARVRDLNRKRNSAQNQIAETSTELIVR